MRTPGRDRAPALSRSGNYRRCHRARRDRSTTGSTRVSAATATCPLSITGRQTPGSTRSHSPISAKASCRSASVSASSHRVTSTPHGPAPATREIDRRLNTDSALGQFASFIPRSEEPEPNSVAIDSGVIPLPEFERFSSFFGTGGLVAVHSSGRDRNSIWNALGRKEVYGTSGDRILLWFDLLRDSGADLPMGSETTRLRDAALPGARRRRVPPESRFVPSTAWRRCRQIV